MKITAQHPKYTGRTHETIDRTDDRQEAERLVVEYRMAYGKEWTIEIRETAGDKNREAVRQLRAEGLTNSQIADRTGLKFYYVQRIGSDLGKVGLVEKRAAGMRPNSGVQDRNETIACMVDSGDGPRAIATVLEMTYSTVRAIVHKLRRGGRLPRLANGGRKLPTASDVDVGEK